MKTKKTLTTTAAVLGFALMTVATPLMAQSQDSSYSASSPAAGTEMNEPAGADNDTNWSWLGLLGLAGLMGLKRRHDVHDDNYRPARA